MPTDTSSGGGDDLATEASDDDLTFAVHDLGRERATEPAPVDLGFILARPAATPASPLAAAAAPAAAEQARPPADGFVIRQPQGMAPIAPVDALVVGAPEPQAVEDPDVDAPPEAFRISSATAARVPSSDQLWTTRTPSTETAVEAPPAASRRGWTTRHSEVVDRSAHATMLRLREEAVNVSWKAAWIAVTSCSPRLLRKRSPDSPLN